VLGIRLNGGEMKYFKVITPDTANMDGETSEPFAEKIKASKMMQEQQGVSGLFAVLSPKELAALRKYKGVE